MHYNQNDFKYLCSVCKTSEMISIENNGHTQVQYCDITDDKGNTHSHDHNDGEVYLICKNNHETTKIYIPSCECGWNELYQGEYSCETFLNSKQVKGLFDSDDEF